MFQRNEEHIHNFMSTHSNQKHHVTITIKSTLYLDWFRSLRYGLDDFIGTCEKEELSIGKKKKKRRKNIGFTIKSRFLAQYIQIFKEKSQMKWIFFVKLQIESIEL